MMRERHRQTGEDPACLLPVCEKTDRAEKKPHTSGNGGWNGERKGMEAVAVQEPEKVSVRVFDPDVSLSGSQHSDSP